MSLAAVWGYRAGYKFRPEKRNASKAATLEAISWKGSVTVKPFSFRNRRFTMQVPGEVILFLLVKLTLLVSLGINLMR